MGVRFLPGGLVRLKRLFYKFVTPIRKLYWFVVRPKTYGVKVLIEHNGKFVMIRNSYGHKKWTFPGGGMNSNETPKEAAVREAFEEVGIALENVRYLGEYFNTRQYKRDTVYAFYSEVRSEDYKMDPLELEEVRWFDASEIPLNQSDSVKSILSFWAKLKKR